MAKNLRQKKVNMKKFVRGGGWSFISDEMDRGDLP
jgi:hypothetical protein